MKPKDSVVTTSPLRMPSDFPSMIRMGSPLRYGLFAASVPCFYLCFLHMIRIAYIMVNFMDSSWIACCIPTSLWFRKTVFLGF